MMASAKGGTCTLSFRVEAETSYGEQLCVVGSDPAMGNWDPAKGLALTTTEKDYPCWSTKPVDLSIPDTEAGLEYKYVRIETDGTVRWEVDGDNRSVPSKLVKEGIKKFIIHDGQFGTLPSETFGYDEEPGRPDIASLAAKASTSDEKLVVLLGDAVAASHRAWRLDGWAAKLGKALKERYELELINLAKPGHCAKAALQELSSVAPLKPKVVILSFGAEVQRLASLGPEAEAEWPQVVSHYVAAMEDLVCETWQMGALPVIGGLYPHADFLPEHLPFLKKIEDELKRAGVYTIDFLTALSDPSAKGTWQEGFSNGPAHPNTKGHAKMFSCINLAAFDPEFVSRVCSDRAKLFNEERVCFNDKKGFEVRMCGPKRTITVVNKTENDYNLNPRWHEVQAELEAFARLVPLGFRAGAYLASGGKGVWLSAHGRIETEETFPAGTTTSLQHFTVYSKGPDVEKVLYNDTNLALLKEADSVRIVNFTQALYNVHPMWQEVRCAMKALPHGIYEDSRGWDFRTAIVSCHGLQSRIKVPPQASLYLKRTGPLSNLQRVALVPLGDRCSVRMLLHKIEYDGPCYPFDLTRTTGLGDVADIVGTGFSDMWNPNLLEYNHDLGRIHHQKWQGLSFAHEVEDGDDPIMNFCQVTDRMAKRYASRAARFDFACKHAERVLFLRTGGAARDEVADLMRRLGEKYPGMKYQLLLISDQDSGEFSGMQNVMHIRESFNPDLMYEDMNYWLNCSFRFRGILQGLGVDARTLYWCPNNLKEAEIEMKGGVAATTAAAASTAGAKDASDSSASSSTVAASTSASTSTSKSESAPTTSTVSSMDKSRNFSHSKLYEVAAQSASAGQSDKKSAASSEKSYSDTPLQGA
mmetsp:Transcript_58894/g.140532  ORF Transcript_58894/g.140532 Transcript_58894/m.140532 type:complete len:869 (+) Transcript_58894:102-2708(+)